MEIIMMKDASYKKLYVVVDPPKKDTYIVEINEERKEFKVKGRALEYYDSL